MTVGNELCFLIDLKESNVSLKLTIVETVGFGDQINKEDRYEALRMLLL